jgi:hypothetical protein
MSQGIKYTICYKQALALEQEKVQILKETISALRRALADAEEKIRISPFVQ